jgi:hypothetical protein
MDASYLLARERLARSVIARSDRLLTPALLTGKCEVDGGGGDVGKSVELEGALV